MCTVITLAVCPCAGRSVRRPSQADSDARQGIRYADVRAADRTTNIVYCVMTGIRFDPLPDANNNNNALHTWSVSWLPFRIDDHPRDTGTRVDKVVVICDSGEDTNLMAEAMKSEGASRWPVHDGPRRQLSDPVSCFVQLYISWKLLTKSVEVPLAFASY